MIEKAIEKKYEQMQRTTSVLVNELAWLLLFDLYERHEAVMLFNLAKDYHLESESIQEILDILVKLSLITQSDQTIEIAPEGQEFVREIILTLS